MACHSMASIYLASTVVMGVGLLVMGGLLLAGRKWERYSPRGMTESASGLFGDPRVWIVGFAVLGLGAAAGTVTVLRSADPTVLIFAGAGLIIVAFMAVGTYFTARARGHPHSHAVGEAIAVLGGVTILALVGNLLTNFGA